MDERVTPQHPRWGEFCDRLSAALLPLEDPDTGELSWVCPKDPGFPVAAGLLNLMSGIDVDATLDYFAEHVTCDCEILFNLQGNPT